MPEKEIQKLSEREDLELLVDGDVIEVDGRKKPMIYWGKGKEEMEFLGRNGPNTSLIKIDSDKVSVRNKKAVFNQPFENSTFFPRDSHYRILSRELEKKGL